MKLNHIKIEANRETALRTGLLIVSLAIEETKKPVTFFDEWRKKVYLIGLDTKTHNVDAAQRRASRDGFEVCLCGLDGIPDDIVMRLLSELPFIEDNSVPVVHTFPDKGGDENA